VILGTPLDEVWNDDGTPELRSLPDYLRHRAAATPDQVAVTFMDYEAHPDGVARQAGFAELDRRVGAVAAALAGIGRDERVAILAPQSLEYVVGFLGVLRAGAIAVPLFPPDLPGHADRLVGATADSRPSVVLTVRATLPMVREFVAAQSWPAPRAVLAVDELAVDVDGPLPDLPDVTLHADDPAYLQYTSGSTRAPAGVVISHGNVVANAKQAVSALLPGEHRGTPVTIVSWLPLFHDMGLVLVCGGSCVAGLPAVLMDPVAFLIRPVRWLRALSAYENTGSMAPNFAFDYCARQVSEQDKAELRMDRVYGLINGAEPVNPQTHQRFNDAFAGCGLNPTVLRPGYGLAEATVYVAGSTAGRPPMVLDFDRDELSHGRAVPLTGEPVGVGAPMPGGGPGAAAVSRLVAIGDVVGQYLAIADETTGELLADGTVGEIWVNGPNVASGYWDDPQRTAATFGQELRGELPARVPRGGWLRTGDLGVLHDGEFYITGRSKDLIIVGGRNHYPQDIEITVESAHPAIGKHRLAAFSAPAGAGEGVVVVAELSRRAGDDTDHAQVIAEVRSAVSAAHRVLVHDVVLVASDTIPRTSSGKIARSATRQRYLDGVLAPVGATVDA
jgi:acyl-CoA synthetase (AMP-forming)/AMP-acid ligase II